MRKEPFLFEQEEIAERVREQLDERFPERPNPPSGMFLHSPSEEDSNPGTYYEDIELVEKGESFAIRASKLVDDALSDIVFWNHDGETWVSNQNIDWETNQ